MATYNQPNRFDVINTVRLLPDHSVHVWKAMMERTSKKLSVQIANEGAVFLNAATALLISSGTTHANASGHLPDLIYFLRVSWKLSCKLQNRVGTHYFCLGLVDWQN